MSVSTYMPDSTKILHTAYADFVSRQIGRTVHVVQYDDSLPLLAVKLFSDGQPYTIPSNADISIKLRKSDGKFVYNPALGCDSTRRIAYFEISYQMVVLAETVSPVIEVRIGTSVAASSSIGIIIDRNPIQREDIESTSEWKVIQQAIEYSKEAVDSAAKATSSRSAAAVSEENASNSELEARRQANASDLYSTIARSYAVGDADYREGEETDNAKYYYQQTKNISKDLNAALNLNNRDTYRGKDLGNSVTAAQKAAIQNGTFDNLFIGDYWTIGGVKWLIADMDYWYNCGDTAFTKHHLVIVSESSLYTAKMNTSNNTEGGYVGSKMRTENLANAESTITSAFGNMVLTHREYLVNAVYNGKPSAGAWVDSTVDLMNECMVYGHPHFTPTCDGSTVPTLYTIDKTQLSLFALRPQLIVNRSSSWWLRDIVSSTRFSLVGIVGWSIYDDATNSYGVRPAFAIG